MTGRTPTTDWSSSPEQYLRALSDELRGAPSGERDEILASVRQHLASAVPPGAEPTAMRDVLENLGDPARVASENFPTLADGRARATRHARNCLIAGVVSIVIFWAGPLAVIAALAAFVLCALALRADGAPRSARRMALLGAGLGVVSVAASVAAMAQYAQLTH